MLGRIAGKCNEVPSEILFGGEGVMSATAQSHVVQAMLAASREGERVMKLEQRRLRAAIARVTRIGAAPFVAFEDRAPDRRRDVSAAPARVLGPGLGLGFGLVPDLGLVLGLRFVFVLVFVLGLGRVRGTAARAGRNRVLLTLKLGHQRAHGA